LPCVQGHNRDVTKIYLRPDQILTRILHEVPLLTSYCDQKATLFEYLAAINIKALTATKRNPKRKYEIRTGARVFVVASRWLPSWAVRQGMGCRPAGLMHAKVWPRAYVIGWAIRCGKEVPEPLLLHCQSSHLRWCAGDRYWQQLFGWHTGFSQADIVANCTGSWAFALTSLLLVSIS
jgi:hypothetical protein